MKLLFCGSPAFAVPSLRRLHRAGHRIELVVTRPDRPRGRSGRPVPTPVKQTAAELGLPVFEPESINAPESVARLRHTGPELGVVVAYGELLSAEVLCSASGGFLNLHASLLPAYRGAAPVNWAIIRGESVTGVSIIRMVPRLDAGPILAQSHTPIGPDETAGELAERLATLGAELLADVVNKIASGAEIEQRTQPARAPSLAPKLTKRDGRIDWSLTAQQIRNRVRGMTPWPGAFCELRSCGRRLRVILLRVELAEGRPGTRQPPGTVLAVGREGILVQAGEGAVRITELKPAGRRAMRAEDFLRGHAVEAGARFA